MMEKLAQTVIQSRKKLLEEDVDSERKDLIHLLLTTQDSDGVKRLSEEENLAQTMTFINTGHDAPGLALSSILYNLSKNPYLQDKLRKEIESEAKVRINEMRERVRERERERERGGGEEEGGGEGEGERKRERARRRIK